MNTDNVNNPDQELIAFADYFASNYQNLDCGNYYSQNKKYHIQYAQSYSDDPGRGGPGRIEHRHGRIELQRVWLLENKGITGHYVFFVILFLVSYLRTEDTTISDQETLVYYSTTGRPLIDIIVGYELVCEYLPEFQLAKDRLSAIELWISEFKKHKPN